MSRICIVTGLKRSELKDSITRLNFVNDYNYQPLILQLGGPHGERIEVKCGDVIILPAGTGHISLRHSDDFAVVGAYPDGIEPDLIKITDEWPKGVRERVDHVTLPENDPLYGKSEKGVLSLWK